jgi:hypothetical protein
MGESQIAQVGCLWWVVHLAVHFQIAQGGGTIPARSRASLFFFIGRLAWLHSPSTPFLFKSSNRCSLQKRNIVAPCKASVGRSHNILGTHSCQSSTFSCISDCSSTIRSLTVFVPVMVFKDTIRRRKKERRSTGRTIEDYNR